MHSQSQIGKRDHYGEQPGRGFWVLLACCVPLIVLFALIALRII